MDTSKQSRAALEAEGVVEEAEGTKEDTILLGVTCLLRHLLLLNHCATTYILLPVLQVFLLRVLCLFSRLFIIRVLLRLLL